MIFLTHLLGGIVSVVYFGGYLGVGVDGNSRTVAIVAAAVFSVLPDIDMVKSKVGKKLQPFSNILALIFRHRGFLHSFVFAALIYGAVRYMASPQVAAAAAIGYASHLALDSLTKEGVIPFLPLSKRRIRGFIKTGGIFEKVLMAAMAVLLLLRLSFA